MQGEGYFLERSHCTG